MSKLALVFHSLSLVIGIVAIWVTSSRVTKFENEQAQIRQAQEEIASKEKELKDLQKEIASSILREKNRLQDEADEFEEIKEANELNQNNLEVAKNKISQTEDRITELKELARSLQGDQNSSRNDLQETQNLLSLLRQEIPSIQRETQQVISETEKLSQEIAESAGKMSSYSSITDLIKEHYSQTTSSLRTYARERPWLEPGEVLNLQIKRIDLSLGIIALPKGSIDGIREKMLFAVHSQNKQICKIKIKQAFRTHALAEVVPLVGRPNELLKIEYVDLVVL